MTENRNPGAAPSWVAFEPPTLPDQAKLDSVIEQLARLTPQEIVAKSVATGIHESVGHGLTRAYKPPDPEKLVGF